MSRLSAVARVLGRLALTVAVAAPLYLAIYRPLELHWGATSDEIARAMPGDGIAPSPIFNATRAITIDARPENIWPWLVQIGYLRAGWYSNLDWLDNNGIVSADQIIPALQRLQPGDTLPVWVGINHRVVAIETDRYLLDTSPTGADSWVWALAPIDAGHTRLIWRMRNGSYDWNTPAVLLPQLATDLGDFIIVRNILFGIKERAEGRPLGSLAVGTSVVALWVLQFFAFLVSLAALVVRRDWLRPLLAVAATCALTLLLVFTIPPLWLNAIAVIGTYGGRWWLYRAGGIRDRRVKAHPKRVKGLVRGISVRPLL